MCICCGAERAACQTSAVWAGLRGAGRAEGQDVANYAGRSGLRAE